VGSAATFQRGDRAASRWLTAWITILSAGEVTPPPEIAVALWRKKCLRTISTLSVQRECKSRAVGNIVELIGLHLYKGG
jgi:hypothetical protein